MRPDHGREAAPAHDATALLPPMVCPEYLVQKQEAAP